MNSTLSKLQAPVVADDRGSGRVGLRVRIEMPYSEGDIIDAPNLKFAELMDWLKAEYPGARFCESWPANYKDEVSEDDLF